LWQSQTRLLDNLHTGILNAIPHLSGLAIPGRKIQRFSLLNVSSFSGLPSFISEDSDKIRTAITREEVLCRTLDS